MSITNFIRRYRSGKKFSILELAVAVSAIGFLTNFTMEGISEYASYDEKHNKQVERRLYSGVDIDSLKDGYRLSRLEQGNQ